MSSTRTQRTGLALLLLVAPLAAAPAAQTLLEIERFELGPDGLPLGWRSQEGARSGVGPASDVAVEDGALVLAGEAATGTWRYLAHALEADAGSFLRVSFEGRLEGARIDPRQFDNHFVCLAFTGADEAPLGRSVHVVSSTGDWAESFFHATVPAGARGVELAVFLSHTGRMSLRRVSVRALLPPDSFDMLVETMGRDYSHFASKDIDWSELVGRYRGRVLEAARGTDAVDGFLTHVRHMLSELRDGHVWLEAPGRARIGSHQVNVTPNVEPPAVHARILQELYLPGVALIGRTEEGFGYVGLGTFQLDEASFGKIEAAFRDLLDAPGLLIDVRANGGGNEGFARLLAGYLTTEPLVYSLVRGRDGPQASDLSEPHPRLLQPRSESERYRGPVVCLTGPGCVSSCECFVQMMKALPGATVLGQTTRGSSGNPAAVRLPNGVSVFFSRWVNLMPDGSPIEDVGIAPDIAHPHGGNSSHDATLEAGFAELARLLDEG